MKKSESIVEINKALVNFRKEVKQPKKDAKNPFYKSSYSTLDVVIEAIDNAATKHGLSFIQYPTNNEKGEIGITTMLLHESGEMMEFEPVFMKPEKNTPQAAGSVISYLRRYSISAIFGITSDEDDDGNQASGNNKQNNYQQRNNQQRQKPRATQTNDNKLPMQDKGKLQLAKQKATDLADIINSQDGADINNLTTQEQIINAYVNKVGASDLSKTSNEQLVNILQLIEKNINKYKDA